MHRYRLFAPVFATLVLSLFLFNVGAAQEEPIIPPEAPLIAEAPPADMEFQPPVDANSLDDFLPPGIVWNQVIVPAPGQSGLAAARTHATQAFAFTDEIAVVMEAGTVPEDVELQFTLISMQPPEPPAITETPIETPEPPAEETPETPEATGTSTNGIPPATGTLTPTISVLEAPATPTTTATLTETGDVGDAPTLTPTATPTINGVATETAPPTKPAPVEPVVERDKPERVIEFQLEAVKRDTGEAVGAFERKARIVVDLRSYGFDVSDGGTFFLAYQNPLHPEEWTEVPITIHQSDGLLSADVAHFSSWATGWRPEGWTLQWEPPSADGFTGAARYNYSFQLPPGRAGLAPSLSLSYSNAALNGAIKRVSGGDVASGWSLNEIAIVRTGVKMSEGSISAMDYPNTFRLVLNGEGYKLVPDANGVRYYAENAPHLRINRYADYWTVETGDGTMYRLGYTDAARTWHHFVLNEHLDEDSNPDSHATHHSAYIEWHADTITDRFGNQVVYQRSRTAATDHYEEIASCPWGGFCVLDFYTHASRLQNIYYNFQGRQNITSLPVAHNVGTLSPSTAATRVELLYNSLGGRLSDVKIYHNSGSNPIRQYGLVSTPQQVPNPGCKSGASTRYSVTHELTSITEYGWDGATGARHALPPVSFAYEARNNYVYDDQSCFIFKHLSEVSNGYGGKTTFTYANDGRAVGTYTNTGSGPTEYPQVGYSHYVSQVAHYDGRKKSDGTLRSGIIAYARSGPCYNQYDSGYGPRCQVNDDAPRFGVLSGFADVTATYKDYDGSVTHLVRTTYNQDVDRFGKPALEEVRNAANVVLTKSVYEYTITQFGSAAVPFVFVSQLDSFQYQNGAASASLATRVRYFYDVSEQGGQQWGKRTKQEVWYQKDGSGTYVLEQRQLALYRGDTARWLSVPWSEAVYDASWQPKQLTMYLYDGQTNNPDTQTLTKGILTWQRLLLVDAPIVSGGNTRYKSSDTQFSYDAYGNQSTIATYAEYGEVGHNGSHWVYSTLPASTHKRSTTIVYDTTYHLYPVSVENPAGHITTFQIYGFNDSLDGFQQQTGLLKSVTDPNNVVTKYEYDPFGRLHAVYDAESNYAGFANTVPWDGNPLQRYRYWDNAWNNPAVFLDPANNKPFHITEEKRPDSWPAPASSSSSFAFNDQTFYDGLGRPIQQRSVWAWIDGLTKSQEIYTTTDYNAQGQVVCQTAPYNLAAYSDRGLVWPTSPFDPIACTSKPRTTTTYDALNRPDIVTAPDGSTTDNNHYILNSETVGGTNRLHLHQVIDANRHVVNYFYDAADRLVQVRNYTGTDPWTFYASTTYTYDVPGNLVNVKDAAGNVTTMSYDALGRKKTMTDPDMGSWSYGYDAAGNLVWQKDARGKQLCFTYDALDRVKVRFEDSSPTDPCPTPPTSGTYHLATYTYDTATYGKGQLATVSWGPSPTQNNDTFFYDIRGRAYKQTRLIDGRSYTLETTSFDALNRPLTVKYPSTETVTYAYDREGEDRLWAGASLLVDKVTYNARAQMVRLRRGNALETVFSYYGQTGTAGNSNYRLQSMVAGSLLNFQYQYDKVGNITLMTDGLLGSGLNTQTFTYDELNRLKTAYTPGGAVGYYNHTYAYDQVGNITSRTESGVTTGYTYLDTAHKHAVTHLGGAQKFWYDANGNMTKRTEGSLTYVQTFDAENRLATVTNGSAVTTFSYDAAGQRTRTQQPNGVKTYYPFPGYEEEVNGSTTTRRTTYSLAGQAVAHRTTGPVLMEGFAAGQANDWTPYVGTWGVVEVNGNKAYRQSNTTETATNSSRPLPQSGAMTYEWTVTYESGGRAAGLHFFADQPDHVNHGNSYMVWQDSSSIRIYESINNALYQRASVASSNSNGQTYQYKATYNPTSGLITVWRDGTQVLSWTDASPLKSGNYIALRTNSSQVLFDDLRVTANDGIITYLHTDHLGSTTRMSYQATPNTEVAGSTARYYPFGAWRTTPTQTLTDRGYTGHLENMELGLIYMNARYYVPYINRFLSPDTIVPNREDPQSFNRYAYTLNNPLRFTDPTGHRVCEGTDNCKPPAPSPTPAAATPVVTFTGESFTPSEQTTVESAIVQLGSQYAFHLNRRNRELWKFGALPSFRSIRAREAFLLVHGGPVRFVGTYTTPSGFLGERTGRGEVSVNLTFRTGISEMWTLHELGHDFNGQTGGRPYTDLENEGLYVGEEQFAGNTDTGYLRTFDGFKSDRPPNVQNWQYYTVNEDFADTFANWAARNFASDVYGQTRQNWVANHMDHWVSLAVAQNQ